MKAVIHTRYGPPDVLKIADIPLPQPAVGEIRVRVHACTVNRTDTGLRSAIYWISRLFTGLLRPKRPQLGSEFAGIVDALGPGATAFAIGDRVAGRLQDERMGAQAEYCCIPETEAVARMPDDMGFTEAAALCDGAMLALMYLNKLDPKTQPRLLINGASGAIGSAGLQLAKARGFDVTAVVKTPAIGLARELGADRVIDYTVEDFTRCGETFDAIFDSVGKSTLGACKPLMPDGGVYMSTELGPYWQNPFLALRTALIGGKHRVYFPTPKYLKTDLEYFLQLASAGQYRPVIDRVYPLDAIVEANTYVETGEKIGNVVVELSIPESP